MKTSILNALKDNSFNMKPGLKGEPQSRHSSYRDATNPSSTMTFEGESLIPSPLVTIRSSIGSTISELFRNLDHQHQFFLEDPAKLRDQMNITPQGVGILNSRLPDKICGRFIISVADNISNESLNRMISKFRTANRKGSPERSKLSEHGLDYLSAQWQKIDQRVVFMFQLNPSVLSLSQYLDKDRCYKEFRAIRVTGKKEKRNHFPVQYLNLPKDFNLLTQLTQVTADALEHARSFIEDRCQEAGIEGQLSISVELYKIEVASDWLVRGPEHFFFTQVFDWAKRLPTAQRNPWIVWVNNFFKTLTCQVRLEEDNTIECVLSAPIRPKMDRFKGFGIVREELRYYPLRPSYLVNRVPKPTDFSRNAVRDTRVKMPIESLVDACLKPLLMLNLPSKNIYEIIGARKYLNLTLTNDQEEKLLVQLGSALHSLNSQEAQKLFTVVKRKNYSARARRYRIKATPFLQQISFDAFVQSLYLLYLNPMGNSTELDDLLQGVDVKRLMARALRIKNPNKSYCVRNRAWKIGVSPRLLKDVYDGKATLDWKTAETLANHSKLHSALWVYFSVLNQYQKHHQGSIPTTNTDSGLS